MVNQSQETVDEFAARRSNGMKANRACREGSGNMLRRRCGLVLMLVAALLTACQAQPAAAQYRGAPAGWPYNTGGYYATYPVSGNGQPYYVARPIAAVQRPVAMAYAPVNAAYANPNYFGTYATTQAAYNPAPTTAYYPQSAAAPAYAPSSGYAISPAGTSYAGSEAATYFGQPTTVNYVAPRVTYRPAYAASPVYAYQPVVAYQVGAQPTNCYQPAPVATGCGAQGCRRGFLSFLNPFNWFRRRCCGSAPTTAYCGAGTSVVQCGTASGCGQPYYPTQPTTIIPTVPAPAATIPSIRSPIIGTPTVPPPPTRSGTTTIVPAETRPSLAPGAGGSFPTGPSSTITPGGSFTPAPSSGFGVPPAGAGGSFPSGSNYAPEADPYISGANYRGTRTPPKTIREPGSSEASERALPPSVQPVPDPDASKRAAPSRAPQLLDPRDKTASVRTNRWAVVPAVWPTKERGGRVVSQDAGETSPYLQNVATSRPAHELGPVKHFVPSPAEAVYDDGGWKSAR
jgi:hypothetical protein